MVPMSYRPHSIPDLIFFSNIPSRRFPLTRRSLAKKSLTPSITFLARQGERERGLRVLQKLHQFDAVRVGLLLWWPIQRYPYMVTPKFEYNVYCYIRDHP